MGVALDPGAPDGLDAGYPPHWGHGLGMGWERPWFIDSEELGIEDGMYLAIERRVVTVEEGTAAAEQDLLVDADGAELFTAGPREVDMSGFRSTSPRPDPRALAVGRGVATADGMDRGWSGSATATSVATGSGR